MLQSYRDQIEALFSPVVFKDSSGIIKKAELLSKIAHWRQIDRDGKPHWHHCIEVAKMMNAHDDIVVALLHDVYEDCKSKRIKNMVDSFLRGAGPVSTRLSLLTWDRKNTTRGRYLERIMNDEQCITIKMADIIHNLSRLEKWNFIKRKKYERELNSLRRALWKKNSIYIKDQEKQARFIDRILFLGV